MNNHVELRVKEMMGALFNMSSADIGPGTSVDNVESWDSLNHMKLVMALEEAYAVEFTELEVAELLSLELVMLTLLSKGVS